MIYLINAENTATYHNMGMKTVDLAWEVFLKKNRLNLEFKRITIGLKDKSIEISSKIILNYDNLKNFDFNQLRKDDILIYWGDFIHSRHYLKNDLKRLTVAKRKQYIKKYILSILNENIKKLNENEYYDLLLRFYLLDKVEPFWKATFSFGTTLVGDNDIDIFFDDKYKKVFKDFLKKIDFIWTRDAFSALQVAKLRKDFVNNYLGIDAALLIGKEDYLNYVVDESNISLPNKKYLLVHFTRTNVDINLLMNFVFKIADKFGYEVKWIPWLSKLTEEKFNNIDSKYLEMLEEIQCKTYSDYIHLIMKSSLIVTDTYHLSLVGWRINRPVIAIGFGLQYPTSTVDDKKKEIFYFMNNILPFYFYAENMNNNDFIKKYVHDIEKILNDNDVLEYIYSNLNSHAKGVEKVFLEKLLYCMES